MKKLCLSVLMIICAAKAENHNPRYARNVIYITDETSHPLDVRIYATARGMHQGKIERVQAMARRKLAPNHKQLINTADFNADIGDKYVPVSELFTDLANVDIEVQRIRTPSQLFEVEKKGHDSFKIVEVDGQYQLGYD